MTPSDLAREIATQPGFVDCLRLCVGNRALLAEYDRLTGSNLARRGAPIDVLVDDATGRTDGELRQFVQFCFECVWQTYLAREATHA